MPDRREIDLAIMGQRIDQLEKITDKLEKQAASLERTTVIMDVNYRQLPALILDVKAHGKRLSDMENKSSYNSGALWAVGIIAAIISFAVSNVRNIVGLAQ